MMARQQADREDLLGEATALIQRVELDVDGEDVAVVVGFRANGAVSVFFGADPVYQFTTDGMLRRAYAGDHLIKAERGRLVALARDRTGGEVGLVRDEWDDATGLAFLACTADDLARLSHALDDGRFRVVGQVPDGVDVVGRVRDWLRTLSHPLPIADSAGVR